MTLAGHESSDFCESLQRKFGGRVGKHQNRDILARCPRLRWYIRAADGARGVGWLIITKAHLIFSLVAYLPADGSASAFEVIFRPVGAWISGAVTHGLRRGLHSCAALRLKVAGCVPPSRRNFGSGARPAPAELGGSAAS